MNSRIFVVLSGFLLSACGNDQPPVQTVVETPEVIVLSAPVAPPEVLSPQPQKAVKTQAPQQSVASQPSPSLDLRLPKQLAGELRFDDPLPEEPSVNLLPPLFVKKPKPERNFQLGGSLLTNQNLLDGVPTMKAIDGAELQLEYKH